MLDTDRTVYAMNRGHPRMLPYQSRSAVEVFHVRTVLRHLPLIAAVIALALAGALLVILSKARSYEAQAQIILENRQLQLSQQDALVATEAIDTATVQNQIELIRSERTATQVARDLALASRPAFQEHGSLRSWIRGLIAPSSGETVAPTSDEIDLGIARQLIRSLNVSRVGGSYILDVSFRSADPVLSAEIANGFVASYMQKQAELNRQASQSATAWLRERIQALGLKASLVSAATPVATPIGPGPATILGVGLIVGTILALASALLIEILDDRIRRREDVERLTSAEAFGILPRLGKEVSNASVITPRPGSLDEQTAGSPRSDLDEQFRAVMRRTYVGLPHPTGSGRPVVLGVTGVKPGAGTTTVAVELSRVMSAAGKRVLLVDGNPAAPRLSALLAARATVGLDECLAGRAMPDAAVHRSGALNILPASAGMKVVSTNEDLWLGTLPAVLASFGTEYDQIVVDFPALTVSPLIRACAPALDQILLVLASGEVTVRQSHDAIAAMGGAEGALVGVLINHPARARRWWNWGRA